MRKVVISGMIGNGLEWYDFALYGYFATVISQQFFPSSDPYISLISTYGAFAAGFLMRPFGAIFFGMLGDKYGRKISLTLSILLMAIPTACIGLLPTYEQIGVFAPILLTVIRLLQGLSLGGEFSGSITFIVEHSKDNSRGAAGSTTIISLVLGMLAGSLVATFFAETLSQEDLLSWGWRVPFIIGIAIGFVGFYIRKFTHESPKYTKAKSAGALSKRPIHDVFTKHFMKMAQAIGIYISVTVPFYIFSVFMITYYSKIIGAPLDDALLINLIGMVFLIPVVLVSGWASDKIGRKRILIGAAIGYLIFAYPIFALTASGVFIYALTAQIIFALFLGLYIGPVPAVLVELLPTSVRYTGMAISYNVCAALFGGTAPLVSTWLIKETGNNAIVAAYIMICAVVSLFTLSHFKDKYQQDID
ncbi:MAG: proP 1 [Rickettsiales bacterium]|jgi:MHS family proline/betaine transporter-like MFS transporter|nr:proP 1 [Rickettsiales bacterium]